MKNKFCFFSITCLLVPPTVAQLNILAQHAGKKYFGTATNEFQFEDAPYLEQLSNTRDFHQLTPANSMKWESTEPVQGVFNFTGGDMIVSQAEKHRQLVRGHNCVWHSQLPAWVSQGTFDNATLLSIVENHCSTIVRHYKGKILSWDVINEPLNEDGTFRESIFFNTTGTAYIAAALRAARAADPSTKLYINDFNIEGLGPKSTGMFNLVKSLKKQRVPIDGIGVQAHLIVGQLPTTIVENLRQFASLGVEVAITELDIRMPAPPTKESLEQQKKDYDTVVSACRVVRECVGITVWDYTDKYSWVPGTFAGEGAACPWDENLEKKPAYQGIAHGFLPPRY